MNQTLRRITTSFNIVCAKKTHVKNFLEANKKFHCGFLHRGKWVAEEPYIAGRLYSFSWNEDTYMLPFLKVDFMPFLIQTFKSQSQEWESLKWVFLLKWSLKQLTKDTASCWELFHVYNVKSHTWCAMVQFDRWWISELCVCEKTAVVLLSLSDFWLTQFDDMESAGSRPKDDVSLPKGMEPIKPLCCKWLL
jgi:hypothetical protein